MDLKSRNLSPELAAQLTPRARDALGHPLRRQILRTLNESDGPRSPSEIAATILPQASVSVISYHTQVLESCGSVTISGSRPVHGGVAHLYASTVAGDEQVVAVLQATRQLDRRDRDSQ